MLTLPLASYRWRRAAVVHFSMVPWTCLIMNGTTPPWTGQTEVPWDQLYLESQARRFLTRYPGGIPAWRAPILAGQNTTWGATENLKLLETLVKFLTHEFHGKCKNCQGLHQNILRR